MKKLLIVDDEPLVQIGLKSMLNWSDYDIEVCGTAVNGVQALELIEKYMPEIVISDIKMPVMDGLQLAKICHERYGRLPVFLILTSYEEFHLAQEALRYQVLDYLLKLELDPESLGASIKKAIAAVDTELAKREPKESNTSSVSVQAFHDKFFVRLLHNLFDSEEQFHMQRKNLNLSFDAPAYTVCHCEITSTALTNMELSKAISLYSSTIQMVKEIIEKQVSCTVIPLDMKHFAILFPLENLKNYKETLTEVLNKTFTMVFNYFNVQIPCSIGQPMESIFLVSESYQEARQTFRLITPQSPILFYEDVPAASTGKTIFNISLFKDEISKAFEEYDTEMLSTIFHQITDLLTNYPTRYLQALDAACNIMYLAISLLPDGENTVSQIFSVYPDGYRSIYRQTTTGQIVDWMNYLKDGLCAILEERKKTYKNHTVTSVKRYIADHIEERLSLNDVAASFGISPNYLSLLFKKYCETGFSEYISQMKIAKAKELMANGDYKIYEIADQLGFESAFYFSKVFKKVTGYSPRDYIQTKL